MSEAEPQAVDQTDEPPQADEHGHRAYWASLSAAAGLYRWILASLVTLNGGALLALGSWHSAFDVGGLKAAAMLFFFGCVFAVLAAMVGATAILGIGNELGSGRYRLAAFNPARSRKHMSMSDTVLATGPIVLSALSLSLFMFGGLAASWAFVDFSAADLP